MENEIGKNSMNRQKQQLEREINERLRKLATLGKALRPGFEVSLIHVALLDLLVSKGIILPVEYDISILKQQKNLLDQALSEIVMQQKKLIIPQVRVADKSQTPMQ